MNSNPNFLISEASFCRPDWIRDSAWMEHIPFAFWIAEALRPETFVELGVHLGTSYFAFCQAVDTLALGTRCYAVDTWEGDEQAGFYGNEVYDALYLHNETKFVRFSTLIRESFEVAVSHFEDSSIDLLHIDGCHHYDAARHDWETWRPKLSPRAVVLFHDTNVRKTGFGVHRLWSELAAEFPHFEFHHGYGLGVLAVGGAIPETVCNLFRAREDAGQALFIRSFYSRLGGDIRQRWLDNNQRLSMDGQFAERAKFISHQQEVIESLTASLQAREKRVAVLEKSQTRERSEFFILRSRFDQRAAELSAQSDSLRIQLAAESGALRSQLESLRELHSKPRGPWEHFLKKWGATLRKRRQEARDALFKILVASRLTKRLRNFQRQREIIKSSGLFDKGFYKHEYKLSLSRAADPILHYLRSGALMNCRPNPQFDTQHYLRRHPEVGIARLNPLVHFIEHGSVQNWDPIIEEDKTPKDPWALAGNRIRVAFLSGEPHTPGSVYRVEMPAEALNSSDFHVQIVRGDEIATRRDTLGGAQVLIIWRMPWSGELEELLRRNLAAGQKIVFDADDFLFEPGIANVGIIDGIRTQGLTEAGVADIYGRFQRTLQAADFCTAPTRTLAARMQSFRKPALVIPNGFDRKTYTTSRLALAGRRSQASDGKIRIGYAGGTRTHQKDFLQASEAVARILRKHPNALLVLFFQNSQDAVRRCLEIAEYPEFAGLESQIEWRQSVPFRQLPDELARFDINLAPLETGNVYCEAKSELKYFEAALVEVPTIASPTVPYEEAIRHGETGYLARTAEEWFECLDTLVTRKDLRQQVGKKAFLDVFWKYGPERRARQMSGLIRQLLGGEPVAAEFFGSEVVHPRSVTPSLPVIPEFDVIIEHGNRADSEADIIVPSFNYAQYVEEALDAIGAQTLAAKGLVVIDDCSSDGSLELVQQWIERNKHHFRHVALLRTKANSGLGLARNVGFAFSEAIFVMPVDPDNLPQPTCLEKCLKAILNSEASVAYPSIQEFGENEGVRSCGEWHPSRFVAGNFIDAMALIRRSAWAAVGGYDAMLGWEDYELWAKFVEMGFWGIWVKDALALYRSHGASMSAAIAAPELKRKFIAYMRSKHPWIDDPFGSSVC